MFGCLCATVCVPVPLLLLLLSPRIHLHPRHGVYGVCAAATVCALLPALLLLHYLPPLNPALSLICCSHPRLLSETLNPHHVLTLHPRPRLMFEILNPHHVLTPTSYQKFCLLRRVLA